VARDRLTAGMYVPKGDDATGILEKAFVATVACEAIDTKLRKAVKKGKVAAAQAADVAAAARDKGLITPDEYAQWTRKETLRKHVIKVDDFAQDFGRAEMLDKVETKLVKAA
jgi:acyl-CoA dehydrogenase